MADWETLQPTFAQGELSPYLLGQANADILRQGAQLIRNGFVTPQGPVITRPATTFLSVYDSLTHNDARVWSFSGPDTQDLFAVFHDGKVNVLDWQSGAIGGTTGPYQQLITNNNFQLGLDSWSENEFNYDDPTYSFRTNVRVRAQDKQAQLYINFVSNADNIAPSYETAIPQLYRSDNLPAASQEFVLQCIARYTNDDVAGEENNPLTGADWKWYLRLSIGTTDRGSEIATQDFELELLTTRTYTLTAIHGVSLPAGTPIHTTVELVGVAQTPLPNGSFAESNTFHFANVDDIYLYARPLAAAGPIELTTPYAGEDLAALHFVQSPYGNRDLVCLHPDHPPQTLYYDSGLTNWVFEEFTFSNAPLVWGVDGKYPSIGAGVQGRLALSGLETNPEIIWLSKTEDWQDFDQGTAQPTDAIELTAQVRDVNTWIIGGKGLLYGDRKKEYEITSQQFLAPNDIGVSLQTSYGTERMPQKILMGKNVVLATGGNNDLRLLHYNRADLGFIAPNIVLKAEHLGRKEFKRHFYTRDPNQMLWSVMRDGTITLCSFDDDLNVQAWSRFETDGFILDGCALNDSSGRNVVVLVVERLIDNQQVINIETIYPLRDVSQWQIVDSAITVFPVSPAVGPLAGFERLEGKEVAVFLDNQFDGLQTVEGGEITVNAASGQVTCGIPYEFNVKTFPQNSISQSLGIDSKKRISQIGVRGLFSLPPLINGDRPPDRSPQAIMNNSQPPIDLLDVKALNLGFDKYAVVEIKEVLPVRVQLAAIYGKLTSNQK